MLKKATVGSQRALSSFYKAKNELIQLNKNINKAEGAKAEKMARLAEQRISLSTEREHNEKVISKIVDILN